MQKLHCAVLTVAMLLSLPLRGQQPKPAESGLPPLLPAEREIALAESAAPAEIAREATIYALKRGGYVVAREGTNGFSCLVVRSFPNTQEPECLDAEGTATILPRILDAARYLQEGLGREQVRRKIAEGFLTGKYRAPRRAGISYMLSCENYVPIDEEGTRVIHYPPHVMFFAPNLTDADLGKRPRDPWMPFVVGEGSPHAYIIVRVGEDASAPRCPEPAL